MAGEPAPVPMREALSRFLSLEMIRATFDVVPRDELEAILEDKAAQWSRVPPAAEELVDIDRQLVAEANYYIVSLSYLVQVGGAVFPSDKAEMIYANDTVVALDGLQRDLAAAVADGADVAPILAEIERIRALTEGYKAVPEEFGIFTDHDELLDAVLEQDVAKAAT